MIESPRELLARLAERRASRARESSALLDQVRARLPAAAHEVRTRFGAREVLLFGSFAHGTPMSRSDVDIAVEGVAARDHFLVMAFLSDALGHTVDLIRLEDLNAIERQRLLTASARA